MDIKTGFRAVLTVGAVLTGTALLSVGYSQYAFVEDTSRKERLDHVANQGMRLIQLTQEVLLYGEPRAISQWQSQYVEMGRLISDQAYIADPDLGEINGALLIRYSDLSPLLEKLTSARQDSRQSADVIDVLASQLFQDATQLQASLRDLKDVADESHERAYKASKQRQIAIFSLFGTLFLMYGLAVMMLFRGVILKPLGDLERTIHAIRDGKQARAPNQREDEIGVICQTFNQLLDEHDHSQREIRAMAERFRNIFEQAAVGMSIVSTTGDWLEVNECLCAILGYPREELLSTNYRRYSAPEFLETDIKRVKAILAGERQHDAWETCYIRKDGQAIWARITTALTRDSDDRPLYFVTVTEDITQRMADEARIGEINRQLEEQARDLRRINADLESFAWVASHDLREPLRMISSYIGLINKRLGPEIEEDMRTYIGYAIGGAKRMDSLILSLLDYSRIGQDAGLHGSVSLNDVLQECQLNLKMAIQEAHATVVLPDRLPFVTGARGDLVRLFQNLIGNAIKFHHPDRPPVVTLTCEEKKDEWLLCLSDNGIGIESQYYDKVFRIFQRLVSKDEYEGTGIGLAICKKIVEHMGGRIWLDSTPGEGTSFYLALAK
ncbi:putative Histidine kinase [Rhodospirillaceae bacterium LM-1]|nr:putative Histidine kinase [Rhodospirillaceae bacterium LM-1]